MSSLILTRGVPGSRKTTWAMQYIKDNPGTLRANRDEIRASLGIGPVGDSDQEKLVTEYQRSVVRLAAKKNLTVILDDTNLDKQRIKQWSTFAQALGMSMRVQDFPVSFSSALFSVALRVSAGGRDVPADVIRKMFTRNKIDMVTGELPVLDIELSKPFAPYIPGKRKAYSFDLDGTLADMDGQRGPYDTSRYHVDAVHLAVKSILDLATDAGYEIIILTGRNEDFRDVCSKWLHDNGIWHDYLLMRPSDQPQVNDAIVKSDLVDKYISNVFDVVMHFDDRDRVVDALRSKGMKVSQVEPGDF